MTVAADHPLGAGPKRPEAGSDQAGLDQADSGRAAADLDWDQLVDMVTDADIGDILAKGNELAAAKVAASAAAIAAAKSKTPAKAGPAKSAGPKRGPGRPSTKPVPPQLEKNGVVSSPADPDCRLEMAYEQPMMFKALFAYFNNIKARELHVRCRPDGMTFFTRDHQKKSLVIANIAGKHVNWYYAETEFWFGINKVNVEKIFSCIDKSFFKISIRQMFERTSSITITFKDPQIDKECSYDISVSDFPRDEVLFAAEALIDPQTIAEKFPVEFTLTAKQFKKTICDACHYGDWGTFERIGTSPLVFTYQKPTMTYKEIYHSDEKIHLRSSVAPGGTFRCMVHLPLVKSLSASLVTDRVRILCAETEYILFRPALDECALVLNTLVPLQ